MHSNRRHERVPFIREALAVRDGTVASPVMTNDLSRGGLGFHSTRSYELGEPLELRIDVDDSQRATIRGVVRVQQVDADGNRVGLEFDRLLDERDHPALALYLEQALRRMTRVEG